MKKIIFTAVAFFVLVDGLFTVSQIENVVVTRLGEPVRVVKTPGLHFKVPFVETVAFFDKRLLSVELSALEVTLGDKGVSWSTLSVVTELPILGNFTRRWAASMEC